MTSLLHPYHPHRQMVALYSAVHFLVDFACAFLLFRHVINTPNGYFCILFYNFCAFAMQMPLGIIADRLNRNFFFAIAGCALVGAAYAFILFPTTFPVAASVILGIGNAMFHLGGGIDILHICDKKLSALGIFVSPGAFGIYCGTTLGRNQTLLGFPILQVLPILLALIIAAVLIFMVQQHQIKHGTYPSNPTFSLKGNATPAFLATVTGLFLVVCLRSFVGLALDLSWKNVSPWNILLISAVVLGKVMGGFAVDRFGLTKTVYVSLGLATLLFSFPAVPIAGIAAVLLFNMTMPITLWAISHILPDAKGFSFGLLTLGLFIGFLPVYLDLRVSSDEAWIIVLLVVGSLILLSSSLRRMALPDSIQLQTEYKQTRSSEKIS